MILFDISYFDWKFLNMFFERRMLDELGRFVKFTMFPTKLLEKVFLIRYMLEVCWPEKCMQPSPVLLSNLEEFISDSGVADVQQ